MMKKSIVYFFIFFVFFGKFIYIEYLLEFKCISLGRSEPIFILDMIQDFSVKEYYLGLVILYQKY